MILPKLLNCGETACFCGLVENSVSVKQRVVSTVSAVLWETSCEWKAVNCFCGLVGNLNVESGLFLWSCGKLECRKRVVSVVLWET